MFYDDIKALIDAGKIDRATYFLHQYEQLHPDDSKLALTLADAYDRQDNWYESEHYYRKAIKLDPVCMSAYTQLEQVLREQARYSECREILATVVRLMPSLEGPVKTSLAMLDMAEHSSLAKGLKDYENRFTFSHMKAAYEKELFPRWNGKESLQGKSILMRYEQGLGDTIQFSRYATLLKDLGALQVDVLCKPSLHRIIKSIKGVDEVIDPKGCEDYDWDYNYEVMMMSIPALLNRTQPSQILKDPYLSVHNGDSHNWLQTMKPTGKFKVGLVWAGDHKRGWQAERMNDRRSVPLAHFRPILDVDCDFYSLQKGDPEKQLEDFSAAHPIKNVMGGVQDFYDTACIIDNLDLVICVDTSTAHLAAGMGKKTWMLSRLDGDWRWLSGRKDSPWYPSMEIFRQKHHAEWRPLINEIAQRLRKLG